MLERRDPAICHDEFEYRARRIAADGRRYSPESTFEPPPRPPPDRSQSQANGSERTNPFNVYGKGLSNYLKIVNLYTVLFLVLSVCALVQMTIFRSFGAVDDLAGYSDLSRWSFSGIGYPMNQCSKAPISWPPASETESIPMIFNC